MENNNAEQHDPGTLPKVKWGIKVRCEPESRLYEVKITLPMGEEDSLPTLMEPSVIQAFPEIMRALESGRLPGNEIDLANR
jgi:hypothetical protein